MKEQIKSLEKELNKMEISNLTHAEFKTLVMRMPKELSKDLSSIRKIQSEMKDTIIEIKNNLQGNYSKMKSRIESLIWNIRKKRTTNQNIKKKKNEDSISSLWNNFKKCNICITGCWKGKRKSKKLEIYLKK